MNRSWLINLRGEATQDKVARESGITQNFYSWIESGMRNPSVKVAKQIAATLGFDWTRFFDDQPPAERSANE